jgi:hypothetical protein
MARAADCITASMQVHTAVRTNMNEAMMPVESNISRPSDPSCEILTSCAAA